MEIITQVISILFLLHDFSGIENFTDLPVSLEHIKNIIKEERIMESRNNVQINLSIPEHYRNFLRRLAAERVMNDPSEVVTGSSIATEILLSHLREMSGETEQIGTM